MNKLLLSLVMLASSCLAAFSQLAVTAGGSCSEWQDNTTSYRWGFYAGAMYVAQSDSSPFCFSGSLQLLNRGVNIDGAKEGTDTEFNFRSSLYSLHLPVAVGYKFSCYKDRIIVVPKVGLYADMGLWGKTSQDGVWSDLRKIYVAKYDDLNPYTDIEDLSIGGVGNFSRFDWGFLGGFDIYLSRSIVLACSYEYGMRDLWNADHLTSRFKSFQVGLGYMFRPVKKQSPKIIEL